MSNLNILVKISTKLAIIQLKKIVIISKYRKLLVIIEKIKQFVIIDSENYTSS